MLGIGKHVKVWQETTNGGLMLVGQGVIETMGMGQLVIIDGLSHVQKFVLQHVALEEDNEGFNELASGTCPKPEGAKGVKVYHKQRAKFHRGGGYRTERYLEQYG
jgi:hypothetical protein